jgi:hypothetical protein
MKKLLFALSLLSSLALGTPLELTQSELQSYVGAFEARQRAMAEATRLSREISARVQAGASSRDGLERMAQMLQAVGKIEKETALVEHGIAMKLWSQMGMPGTDVYPSTLGNERNQISIRFLSRHGKADHEAPDLLGGVKVDISIDQAGRVRGYEAFSGPITKKEF